MPRKNYSTIGELDKLMHWIQHLRNASKKYLIVTQHKKDRDVLKSFKCKNVVYPMEPYVDFVDAIIVSGKPVVLLFNVDRQSNSKCEKLRAILQQNGVKVNTGFRKILFVEKTDTVSGLLKMIHQMAGGERIHSGLPV